MQELKTRLKKIEHLRDKVDAILLINKDSSSDFFYFANTDAPGIFYYDFSRPIVFSFGMADPSGWIKNIKKIKKPLHELNLPKRIGINKTTMDVKTFEKLKKKTKCIDISKDLEQARSIKTKYEITCIRKACDISRKIFSSTLAEITKNTTEFGLKGLIEFFMNKAGVEPAFPSIVASGNNLLYPHHKPGTAKLREPFLIDFGVKYKGYCSDITRTIGSRYHKKIENIMECLYPQIHAGVKAKDLDIFVRRSLGKLNKYFTTSLGHGIGLDVHESPTIHRKSPDIMASGMAFTIEPGLYLKNGIRTENDFLLTDSKLVNLTQF